MTNGTVYRIIGHRDFSDDFLQKAAAEFPVLHASGFARSDLGKPHDVLVKMVQLGLKTKSFPLEK